MLPAEALGRLRHARVEHATSIEHLALTRCPGAQLATGRTRMKISLRFFARSSVHFPADANLPVQFDPIKRQRRIWISLELLSFIALVVTKKDKAILVEPFNRTIRTEGLA